MFGLASSAASLGLPLVVVNGAIGGAVTSGLSGGNILKGAALGALQAGLFYGAGSILQNIQDPTAEIANAAATFVAHGLVGGIVSAAGGGSFGSGFLAGGISSQFDGAETGSFYANVAVHAVGGGFGSVLGGGKFENGAVTGAFGYLFNRTAHQIESRRLTYQQAYELADENNRSNQPTTTIVAIMYKESTFDPDAKVDPPNTATGLMGMTIGAVRDVIANTSQLDWLPPANPSAVDLTDPGTAIRFGSSYLQMRIDRAGGNASQGIANYGTGSNYASQVQNASRQLQLDDANPIATLSCALHGCH